MNAVQRRTIFGRAFMGLDDILDQLARLDQLQADRLASGLLFLGVLLPGGKEIAPGYNPVFMGPDGLKTHTPAPAVIADMAHGHLVPLLGALDTGLQSNPDPVMAVREDIGRDGQRSGDDAL